MQSTNPVKSKDSGINNLQVETTYTPARPNFINFRPSSWSCFSSRAVSPQYPSSTISLEVHYEILSSRVSSISEKSLPFIGQPIPPDLKIYDIIKPAPGESRLITLKNGDTFLATNRKGKIPYRVTVITQYGEEIPALAFFEKKMGGRTGYFKLLPEIQLLFSTYAPLRGSRLVFLYIDNVGQIINVDHHFWRILGHENQKINASHPIYLRDYVVDRDREMLDTFLEEPAPKERALISNLPITFVKEDGSFLYATLSQTSLSPKELCISFPLSTICATPSVDTRAEHALSHIAALTDAVLREHYQDTDTLSTRGAALKELRQELEEVAHSYTERAPILPREIERDRAFLLRDFFLEIKTNLSLLSAKNVIVIDMGFLPSDLAIQGSKSILRKVIGSLIFKHFQSIPPHGQLIIRASETLLDGNAIEISIKSLSTSSSLLSPTFIEAFHAQFPPISQEIFEYHVEKSLNGFILTRELQSEPKEMESILSFSTEWPITPPSDETSRSFIRSRKQTAAISSLDSSMRITSTDDSPLSHRFSPPPTVHEVEVSVLPSLLPTLNILYAEDAPSIRRVTTNMLQKLGQQVIAVDNGEALVRAIETQGPFDLILSDIQMPKMNGDDAIQKIREMGLTLPAIGISGNATEQEIQSYQAKGMNYAYPKPITPETLQNIIIQYAPKQRRIEVIEELIDF